MANEPIPRRDVSSSRSWRDRLPRAIKRVMTSTSGVSADRSLNETLEGLSDAEVASRIARYGFNELPSSKPPAIIRIAFEVVREPMLLLPPVVAVVIAITLDRERKTERALEALRDWSSPRALVVRPCLNCYGTRNCQHRIDCHESILASQHSGHSSNAKSCYVVGTRQRLSLSRSGLVWAIS